MSESPDLSKRRTRAVTTAPDEDRHPIEAPTPAPADSETPARKLPRVNIEVTPEVDETIELARYRTKKTKRALIEEAVLNYWSQYTPGKK